MTVTHQPPLTRSDYEKIFRKHQEYFRAKLRTQSVSERIKKLKRLKKWIFDNQEAIQEAVFKDFRKSPVETDISEINPVLTELKDAIAHLRDWARPKRVGTPLSLFGTSARVRYEPKGVCLIIAPWNFPFNLTIGPLVSAVAAGCAVMIKPSEISQHTSDLMEKMIGELFDPNEVSIHQGDHLVAQEILKIPFNHIFFTGSPQVGKIVMRAAAENLSSVTLELGGMNPVIVDETANIKQTAIRLAWGKFLNCGQACVAPNYIHVHESIHDSLVEAFREATHQLFGDKSEEIKSNPDLARVIDHRHFNRIQSLIDDSVEMGAHVAMGGTSDPEENYIPPTVLTNVPEEAPILHDEIFGPVLPFLKYKNLDEALARINRNPDPLSLYIFSRRKKTIDHVLGNTHAGTTGINEVVAQFGHPHLPFGGHNNSGIGKAHGYYGFMAFTHERAILRKSLPFSSPRLIFPPYTNNVKRLVKIILKWL